MNKPPSAAIGQAVAAALDAPCAKSQRGVAAYRETSHSPVVVAVAHNGPPRGFACPGRAICGEQCRKLACHAEARVLQQLGASDHSLSRVTLVHVKVVDGRPVTSGPPSCLPCAAAIADCGASIWLWHEDGWELYGPLRFYRLTLQNAGMSVRDFTMLEHTVEG